MKSRLFLLVFCGLISFGVSNYRAIKAFYLMLDENTAQIDIHSKSGIQLVDGTNSYSTYQTGNAKDHIDAIQFVVTNKWKNYHLKFKNSKESEISICVVAQNKSIMGKNYSLHTNYGNFLINGKNYGLNGSLTEKWKCVNFSDFSKDGVVSLDFFAKKNLRIPDFISFTEMDYYLFIIIISLFLFLFFFLKRKHPDKVLNNKKEKYIIMVATLLMFCYPLISFMCKNYTEYAPSTYYNTLFLIIFCWILLFLIMIQKYISLSIKKSFFFIAFMFLFTSILNITYCINSLSTSLVVSLISMLVIDFVFRIKAGKFFFLFLVLLNLVPLLSYFYKIYNLYEDDLSSIRTKFTQKPNIYLIVMESYTGKEVFQKIFNYDNTEFENLIKGLGFNIYENFFSVGRSTKASFYTLFTLRESVSDEEANKIHAILEGKVHSVVLDTLKDNGYQIHYAFGDEYLIHNLDSNLFFPSNRYMLRSREHIPEELIPDIINMLPHKEEIPYLFVTKVGALHNVGTLRVGGVCHPVEPYLNSNDPKKYENYKKIYVNEVKKQNPYVILLIKEIIRRDPNGIIVLLGDHGSHINDIYTLEQRKKKFSKFDNCLTEYNVTAAIYWPSYLKEKIPLDMHYNNSIFYNIFKILGDDLNIAVPVSENHCANQYLEKEK